MAYTMTPEGVLNQIYQTRLTLRDYMDEEVQKVSRLANVGDAGNIELFWQQFEAMTNAGLMKGSMQSIVALSGLSTTIANGNHSKVTDNMLLGFTRTHPDYSNVLLTASFVIPAPVNAIVNETTGSKGLPIYERGIAFDEVAGIPQGLGAMIDFLEDALVYQDQGKEFHVGGWTFAEDRSRLFTKSRIIDGISST